MKVVIIVPPFGPLQYPMFGTEPAESRAARGRHRLRARVRALRVRRAHRIRRVRAHVLRRSAAAARRAHLRARPLRRRGAAGRGVLGTRRCGRSQRPSPARIEQRSLFDERLRFLRRAEAAAIEFVDEAARSPRTRRGRRGRLLQHLRPARGVARDRAPSAGAPSGQANRVRRRQLLRRDGRGRRSRRFRSSTGCAAARAMRCSRRCCARSRRARCRCCRA